jgi:hypothetical protein
MRVLIQRTGDGLFLKGDGQWVVSRDQAVDFKNCSPAIEVAEGLQDARLWLSFDDPKHDFPMEVFRAETRLLVRYNKELREKGRALPAVLDQEQAKDKERKRQLPFKRTPVCGGD